MSLAIRMTESNIYIHADPILYFQTIMKLGLSTIV